MKIDWNAVAKVGIPGVIAMFLVYRLALGFDAFEIQLKAIDTQHNMMVNEQRNLAAGVIKLADKQGETQMLQEKILGVLKTMCVQQATTMADRRECIREN